MATAPTMTVKSECYQFSWIEGIEASLERFVESRDGIHAELVIRSVTEGLLYATRMNLLAAPTYHVKPLVERLPMDWFGMLQAMCFLAVERYREGDPIEELDGTASDEKARWLLYPYIEYGGPTILFGDGSTGKSVLAMCMAYSVASGDAMLGKLLGPAQRVMYLDWETNRAIQAQRLQAIAQARFGDCPRIKYRQMRSSLPESVGRIRADVSRHGIGLVITDSLSFAAGGGALVEDVTARLVMNALASIPCCTLGIAHIPKGDLANKDMPFGSVFFRNGARNLWGVRLANRETPDLMTVGFKHLKSNNGELVLAHAYALRFANEGAEEARRLVGLVVKRVDIASVADLEDGLPLRIRILQSLKAGGMPAQALADELDAKPSVVAKTLSQMKRDGLVLQLPEHRWGRVLS